MVSEWVYHSGRNNTSRKWWLTPFSFSFSAFYIAYFFVFVYDPHTVGCALAHTTFSLSPSEDSAVNNDRLTRRLIVGGRSNDLLAEAIAVQENAYMPHSGFRVGAAILLRDGRIVGGCNVENAAYGSTICAERGAIMHAFAEGARKDDFIAVLVVGPAPSPITPCGACRQMLAEFSPPSDPIIVFCCSDKGTEIVEMPLTDLLPMQFPSPEEAAILDKG